MDEQNIRLTTRRIIFLALSVWIVTQALFFLEPFGAQLCVHVSGMYPRDRFGVARR